MSAVREQRALVVGAGLAGAAVCAQLTRRGWHVTLLDAAAGAAQAASALPVGMLSPHVTRAPTPLSRLSALGVADMQAELERLLPPGQGWQACQVDNLGHDPGRWPAALVRPAALVQGWLREAAATGRLQTRWNAPVARLRREAGPGQASHWTATDAAGRELAQAPWAVVASALGSLAVLQDTDHRLGLDALPLRPVKGQMSLAALTGPPLAERPMRNNGVFVPLYEDAGLAPDWPTRVWSMGSTYHRGDASTTLSDADHERNRDSLQAMHPDAARHMAQAARAGELMGWAQVRCASLDRLPLMGAVPDVEALQTRLSESAPRRGGLLLAQVPRLDGLYMLSALGSRGLTLAHWCAQQLAAQMADEPTADVAPDLLQALDPARFVWRRVRKQGRVGA
ncbi:MAG: FAD-dependent oxidoreductase [Hydrogenophaga sp.]|nr:FAD-dependent oxidoreductase [Hydrogenophaga sp.]